MDYRLAVDRRHVVLALRLFERRLRRLKGNERAILGFDGSYFTIEARDTTAIAQAVGAWPGNANVSASLLVALCAAPPAGMFRGSSSASSSSGTRARTQTNSALEAVFH